jgi:hypothetical protein
VAQAVIAEHYPTHDEYFADPDAHPAFARSQFAGLRLFPFDGWALNRLAFHPDLVDAARRYLGTDDLEIYKVELWAKYSGAIDYDQPHHRDYANHSLVVPRADGFDRQLTTFILLSDVTDLDGPTALVPFEFGRSTPMSPQVGSDFSETAVAPGSFADVEVTATGPAGSLLMYRTDILHRGTAFGAPERSRFAMLVDFQRRGPSWAGKMSWPGRANLASFAETMERATPAERELFGFPPADSPYWNAQTRADVQRRYPGMDMTPYGSADAT